MAKEKNKKSEEIEEQVEEEVETTDEEIEESENDDEEGVDDDSLPDYMKVGRDSVEELPDELKIQYLEELTKAMFGYAADFMNQADAFGARNILIGAGRARKAAVMFRKCVTSYRLLSIHVSRLKRAEKAEERSKKTAEAGEAKEVPKKTEKAPVKQGAKKPPKK